MEQLRPVNRIHTHAEQDQTLYACLYKIGECLEKGTLYIGLVFMPDTHWMRPESKNRNDIQKKTIEMFASVVGNIVSVWQISDTSYIFCKY